MSDGVENNYVNLVDLAIAIDKGININIKSQTCFNSYNLQKGSAVSALGPCPLDHEIAPPALA